MNRVAVLSIGAATVVHLLAGLAELLFWGAAFVDGALEIDRAALEGVPEAALPVIAMFEGAARKLLQNSGIYNLIVAAGLGWSLLSTADIGAKREFQSVLLIGAIAAGLYGFLMFNAPNYNILVVQSLVALVALVSIWVKPSQPL